MSNIIQFPRKKRKKMTDVLVNRLTDHQNHVDLGHVPFTCAECEVVSTFDFTNAIFRDISFYCSGCGHGYKVTNPMFCNNPKIVRSAGK